MNVSDDTGQFLAVGMARLEERMIALDNQMKDIHEYLRDLRVDSKKIVAMEADLVAARKALEDHLRRDAEDETLRETQGWSTRTQMTIVTFSVVFSSALTGLVTFIANHWNH